MGDSNPFAVSFSVVDLKEIEDLLKCLICHEIIVTPVLTSCSHSFCSLCIRKWLDTKQCCPVCSTDTFESGLRKNPIIENIVSAFKRLEEKISRKNSDHHSFSAKSGRESPNHTSKTVHQVVQSSSTWNEERVKKHNGIVSPIENVTKSTKQVTIPKKTSERIEETYSDSGDESDDFVPKSTCTTPSTPRIKPSPFQRTPVSTTVSKAKNVKCPCCSKDVPESIIHPHLDKCLLSPNQSDFKCSEANRTPTSSSEKFTKKQPDPKSSSSVQHAPSARPLEPIKKMVYNLMNDTKLKKELKKYGLATNGDRRTLSSRLQRFVTFYNSNCDATEPKSLLELKQAFEKEEKALNMPITTSSLSQIFKTKQFDESKELEQAKAEYRKQNSESYAILINQIKERKPREKVPIMPTVTEQDVDTAVTDSIIDNRPSCSKNLVINSYSEEDSKSPEFFRKSRQTSKRKVICIESDDSDVDSPEEIINNKRSKFENVPSESSNTTAPITSNGRNSSPVFVSKTPVRRELRSRTNKKKSSEPIPKKESPVRKKRYNSKQSNADELVQTSVRKGRGKASGRPVSSAELLETDLRVEENTAHRLKSATPDMFSGLPSPLSPTSSSSSITCGQQMRRELEKDDGEENLSQLVCLMDDEEDNGSSTDFEP